MEQIIKSEQVEREIIKDIESEHGVAALIKHETLVTRKLWEKIFTDDEKEFLDFYYETKAKDSVVFVISREKNISQESIVAMLHLTPQSIILEVCFITSPDDAEAYRKNRYKLANKLAQTIAKLVKP